MAYLLTKTFHLVFVIAWMSTVFYLPRILVNLAEAGDAPAVRERLLLMGRRLYRFGHVMFGIAFVLAQALAVAIVTELEIIGLKRSAEIQAPLQA